MSDMAHLSSILAHMVARADVGAPEVTITFGTLREKYGFEALLKRDLSPGDLSRQVLRGDFEHVTFNGIKFHIRSKEKHHAF